MRLVTAIDEKYYPGLEALHNSIKANSPDTKLSCMVYGDDDLIWKVSDLGIEVLPNIDIPATLPVSRNWPTASPAMYARILIPRLFEERCAWIDADCLVMKPIPDVEFKQPVAATRESATTLGMQIPGINIDGSIAALFSGFMIFNTPEWNRMEITEKCLDAMGENNNYLYVVQSVLSYVLRGNFHVLPYEYQVFANRKRNTEQQLKSAIMLHWVGKKLPWETTTENHDIWRKYADLSNGR